MKQDLVKQAQKIIKEKNFRAKNEYDFLMQPVYNDPEYISLNKEYTKLLIENSKKEVDGLPQNKEMEKILNLKLEEIKGKYGLKNKKIEYECKKCNDTGLVGNHFCTCLKKEISNLLLSESGFERLESFDNSVSTDKDTTKLFSLMKDWCNKNSAKNLIFISGPTGVGKTFLLRCMANELIERGKVVKIVTAFSMNQDFKEFKRRLNEEILNNYLTPEYLFIDDLGTEPKYKDVTIEFLYLIINERKMKKLSTIITSNLDLSDIRDIYDERIFSRIADRETSINIFLNGNDRRIQK